MVDDISMNITHVIRGDDHVNNTPRQVLMYQALGAKLPQFAHVPMILGQDRTRMSKRHGAVSVMAYQEEGFLPEALVNYLVRLGWSHGDQEIFSRQELIDKFSLDNVGKAPSVFDKDKLLWLNAHYIKETDANELVPLVSPFLDALGYPEKPRDYLAKVIRTLQPRVHTLAELAESMRFYMVETIAYEPAAADKFLTAAVKEPLLKLTAALRRLETFNEENLERVFKQVVIDELGLKLGKVAQPVRVALTGMTASPGLFEVIDVLQKDVVLKRMQIAIDHIDNK